jgi:excisionase family DNA binding protein
MTTTPLLIRTSEVCRLLGVHRSTVRHLVLTGVLREVRLAPNSQPRYIRADVLALADFRPEP